MDSSLVAKGEKIEVRKVSVIEIYGTALVSDVKTHTYLTLSSGPFQLFIVANSKSGEDLIHEIVLANVVSRKAVETTSLHVEELRSIV